MADICRRLDRAAPSSVRRWRSGLAAKGAITIERRFAPDGGELTPLVVLPWTPPPPAHAEPPRSAQRTPPSAHTEGGGALHSVGGARSGEHLKSQTIRPSDKKRSSSRGARRESDAQQPDDDDDDQKLNPEGIIGAAMEHIARQRFEAEEAAGRIRDLANTRSWIRSTAANLLTDHGDEARRALKVITDATTPAPADIVGLLVEHLTAVDQPKPTPRLALIAPTRAAWCHCDTPHPPGAATIDDTNHIRCASDASDPMDAAADAQLEFPGWEA